MKTSLPFALALLVTPTLARAPEDQSYLGIFVETHQTRIAGMPPMKEEIKLPPGVKIPPSVMAMMSGKPKRILTVRLWSPTIAPQDATASIAPPAGLKLGDKLDLDIFRPTAAAPGGGGGGGGGEEGQMQNFTVKIYWGSSDTVQPGQPKVFTTANMTPDQMRDMGARMRSATPSFAGGGKNGAGYYYKAGWSTGYWPTDKQPGEVAEDAAMPGTYTLSTNYTGNVSIDAPSNVDFMAPIDLTSPDLSQKPDLSGSMPLKWNTIPNALGQYASAFGMERSTNTLILWCSSEVYADALMSENGFLQMAEVQDMVQKKIFMDGSATAATIPAGIFKDADMVMLNMIGYGPGTAKDNVQPLPRIQTKTSLNVMIPVKRGG